MDGPAGKVFPEGIRINLQAASFRWMLAGRSMDDHVARIGDAGHHRKVAGVAVVLEG
ncbi:hypothetical protein [Paenarthrobacter sp. NPDC018779]|uniref:hypothetical protein n=1 Tax=Paenarthrobacter sp. NPDC018779 TaxID=3364375 RepID=UPI0037CC2CBD